MKKLLIFLLIALSVSAFGQDKKKLFYLLNQGGVSSPSYGAEYTALTDYLAANSITLPDDNQAVIINNALTVAGASTVWSKIIGFWYFKQYGKSFGQVNIKNPGTYNLTEVGTMNYVANEGVYPSNTTSWYNTGINPNSVTVRSFFHKQFFDGGTTGWIGARVSSTNYFGIFTSGTLRYAFNNATRNFTFPGIWNSNGSVGKNQCAYFTQRNGGTIEIYNGKNSIDSFATAELTSANTNILISAIGDPTTPVFAQTASAPIMSMALNNTLTSDERFDLYQMTQKIETASDNVYGLYSPTIKSWGSSDVPDVYIILGQSNALGNVPFPDDSRRKTFPNAWVYRTLSFRMAMMGNGNDNMIDGVSLKTTMGIENNLAQLTDSGSKPVYIIKFAKGNTSVATSGQSFNPTAGAFSQYPNMMGTVNAALQRITAIHGSYNLKATFWIQGEADAGDMTESLAYETNFNTTFEQLKTDLGITDLKIIAAKLSSATSGANPFYANVNSAFDALVSSGKIDATVNTDALTFYDGQHYAVAGYDALALLLYNQVP